MLWTMAFERAGVVVGDIYFVDPSPELNQGAPERGVRLELRLFERDELKGSPYSAVPIRVDRPIWRVDLLETVDSEPGSLNRAHHHPRFHGWEPGKRVFVEELSADPVPWLRDRFEHIEEVLTDAGVDTGELGPDDVEQLRAATPQVMDAVDRLLADVKAGKAGLEPAAAGGFVRSSWL